jgi:hypothetical protein
VGRGRGRATSGLVSEGKRDQTAGISCTIAIKSKLSSVLPFTQKMVKTLQLSGK